MKIVYEVRFLMYRHYSGRGDNGTRINMFSDSFANLDDAMEFHERISGFVKNGTPDDFADSYVWSGYLMKVDGVYKVTEEKLV